MTELAQLQTILLDEDTVWELSAVGDELEGFKVESVEIIDTTRWFVIHNYVVSTPEGKYFQWSRHIGATEYQKSEDVDPRSIVEVKPVKIEVVQYVKV